MTESELAFYQKLMNLIKEAFPHGNFGKWELRNHKESFFPTFLKETPKDEGPYHFTYDIEFSKSAETLNAEIEAVSKKMEGVTDPVAIEKIAKEKCISCHGNDLTGAMGPDLTKIGSTLSESEIKDILNKGKGQMPAKPANGLQSDDEVNAVAKWLSEQK